MKSFIIKISSGIWNGESLNLLYKKRLLTNSTSIMIMINMNNYIKTKESYRILDNNLNILRLSIVKSVPSKRASKNLNLIKLIF